MVTNPSGLSEEHAAITSALGDQIFVFDPCDDGNETWVTREAFVARLGALEPIKTPSAIFQTVLSVNDEVAYSLRIRILFTSTTAHAEPTERKSQKDTSVS